MTYRSLVFVCGLAAASVTLAGCGEVMTAECGNGMVEPGEVCDDGNAGADRCAYGETSCLVCSGSCEEVAGATSYCGDDSVDDAGGEECDDGNTTGDDGCSADCLMEVAVTCGNDTIDAGEDCDDGNRMTEACAYGETACTVCDADCQEVAGVTSYCGDGAPDPGNESCDDGNAETETCAYGETSCTVCDASCQDVAGATAYCGDSMIQSAQSETCDDGNMTDWDGCTGCQPNVLAGMYSVSDGPSWSDNPMPYSCRQACALVFGGTEDQYRCSTSDAAITQSGFYSGWGDGQYCTAAQPDDFVLNTMYDCGVAGCSYSAYVNDHCGTTAINFCWR